VATADKQLFAPMPLRAMATDMSGLQLRVLMCVAAHDRMSLVTGKGQGCRASNERMKVMVGCNYARMCSTLSELVDQGLLQREKLGRHTVYRVIYSDDDRLLFGNTSDAQHVAERQSEQREYVAGLSAETAEISQKRPDNIFPERGGINSVETGEDSSSEDARLSSRDAQRWPAFRDGEPVNETLAKFERRFKLDPESFSNLGEWETWLVDRADELLGLDDAAAYRAQRLSEDVNSRRWEIGDLSGDDEL